MNKDIIAEATAAIDAVKDSGSRENMKAIADRVTERIIYIESAISAITAISHEIDYVGVNANYDYLDGLCCLTRQTVRDIVNDVQALAGFVAGEVTG